MKDELFHEWRAYQKIVENDYLGHAKFFQRLTEEVCARFQESVTILDLGCGDTAPIQGLLQAIPVEHYCGMDVSETALEHARQMLAPCSFSHQLIVGDILENTRLLRDKFDLIIASFSLHHLQEPATKQALLKECRRIIRPGGRVLIIDVFLSENESREGYLDRFEQNARLNYISLTMPEMTTLITHVRKNDFPESVQTYQEFAQEAGFKPLSSLLYDLQTQHRLLSMEAESREECC